MMSSRALHVGFDRPAFAGELDEAPDGRKEHGRHEVERHQRAQSQFPIDNPRCPEGQYRRVTQNS